MNPRRVIRLHREVEDITSRTGLPCDKRKIIKMIGFVSRWATRVISSYGSSYGPGFVHRVKTAIAIVTNYEGGRGGGHPSLQTPLKT